MILDRLVLHNFCLYRGRQELELTPAKRDQPVILVGGLNGGGKTTILDAVQLALYGPRSFTSKREGIGYEAYLRDCINRGVDAKEGASVAVHFRYVSEGEQHTYEVRRQWEEKRSKVHEAVIVYRGGEKDAYLSEHWNDKVEELIPIGISRLFFFDAEQVRFLADDDSSTHALGAAVKSLLGLDMVEKLIADAAVLEGRLSEQIAAVGDDPQLKKLAKNLAKKDKEVAARKQEEGKLRNVHERAKKELESAETAFADVGGDHWLERASRKKELDGIRDSEAVVKSDLLKMASTELPFALVPDLVGNIGTQDEAERNARESTLVEEVLDRRDKELIKALRDEGVDGDTVKLVQQLHKADRKARKNSSEATIRHGLSDSARVTLQHLQNGALVSRKSDAVDLLDRFAHVQAKRDQLDRSLEMTPDDDSVADVFKRLKEATKAEASALNKLERIEKEVQTLSGQRDELNSRLTGTRRKRVDGEIGSEEAARMMKLAVRTQETMTEYLKQATSRKIDRLSQLVSESFQFLLRKQALIDRVEINPESFRITLFDTKGEVLPKERLSEGEKQIFAISVLWGLAKASPRPLPAIIDTPMARLDSEHRSHLVSRYFPHASHQVIVLSTDSEVDKKFYGDMKDSVSHEYHLNYDEASQRTTAEPGYFPSFSKRKTAKK